MRDCKVWQKALDILKSGDDIVIALVVQSVGEVPGCTGSKALINRDGIIAGSIGGGAAESEVYRVSGKKIEEGDFNTQLITMAHDPLKDPESEMICSGTQSFALIPLNRTHINLIEHIKKSIELKLDNKLTVSDKGIFLTPQRSGKKSVFTAKAGQWKYEESPGAVDKLCIVGAGHVSLALSHIVSTLGMDIVLFDNRNEPDTMKRNSFASEKRIISFENIGEEIPDKAYAVIMTYAHSYDEVVLEQLVKKDLKYLAMMASTHKRDQIFQNLRNRGINDSLLRKVSCPAGIAIGSRTPEEIAVSIAAEIISVRNRG